MKNKLNVTAFTSDSLALKILKAMEDALTSGVSQYVENRKGSRWLQVDIKQDPQDGEVVGSNNFQFTASNGQEVGELVARAAWFHWVRPLEIRFSALLRRVYELVMHPLVARREERKQQAEQRANRVEVAERRVRLHARAKQMGATHIVRTEAGKYYFASFKRGLFGFGKTVITVYPKDGETVTKRNGGGYRKTAEATPYQLTAEAAQCVTIIGVLK